MASNGNGKIVWRATIAAHMRRILKASRRWWRDVTHWQPVRRYTGFQVYIETTPPPDNSEQETSKP
jgi:hypothetical protein